MNPQPLPLSEVVPTQQYIVLFIFFTLQKCYLLLLLLYFKQT